MTTLALQDKTAIRYATIFLYPFYYGPSKGAVLDALTRSGRWKEQKFEPINAEKDRYREYVYFHRYIRDIFFSQQDDPLKRPVTYLRYQTKDLAMTIRYPARCFKSGAKCIDISGSGYPIDSIQVNLFEFGVGILAIHVAEALGQNGFQGKTMQEVLCFNQLARRIAPFFDPGEEKEAGLLPDCISLRGVDDSTECFKESIVKDSVVGVSRTIRALLHPLEHADVFSGIDAPSFLTALDERMIVYSYICLDKEGLAGTNGTIPDKDFLTFTLVDRGWEGSFANSGLVPDYLDLHAYDNWRDLGTRYGFTRYSGTCLAVASKSEVLSGGQKPFSYGTLYTHFETIYYEVALLVFFHRATLVRFSKDAADCAELFREARAMQDSERKGRAFERARDLRGEFLLFHNKYWFTEITNQDQGIDMFNRWETALRNKQLFEEVKQELSELNEYIEREHAGNLDLLVGGLTVLAAAGLILTIWLSFLGANIPSIEEWFRLHDSAAAFLAKLFLAVCTFFTLGAIAALIPDFRSKFFGVIENFVRNLK